MKVPTTLLRRPGRAVAVLGATVAVATAGGMAIAVGSATAQETGRCTDNVNVREAPAIDADIVAVCEAGTTVATGSTRGGFVELTNLGGWASQEYVAVSGSSSSSDREGAGSGVRDRSDREIRQEEAPRRQREPAPAQSPLPVEAPTDLLGGLLG